MTSRQVSITDATDAGAVAVTAIVATNLPLGPSFSLSVPQTGLDMARLPVWCACCLLCSSAWAYVCIQRIPSAQVHASLSPWILNIYIYLLFRVLLMSILCPISLTLSTGFLPWILITKHKFKIEISEEVQDNNSRALTQCRSIEWIT